jgi:methionyl-tRNA formyltransferase
VKILFWGTPPFAVPSLRALSEEGHDIVGVVTRPDRPAGRGRELRASAVKKEALDQSFKILEPESARTDT